jgi:hypothetical protein
MNVGLKVGARGAEAERLHRVLRSRGFAIDPAELRERHFGPSTAAALWDFQRSAGLRPSDEVDEETLELLIEFEQNITINITEGQSQPSKPNPRRGQVRGLLVDDKGIGVSGVHVALLQRQLRTESQLAETTSGANGLFTFAYRRSRPLNLFVRAKDAAGKTIAESDTVFGAAASVEIDLTTAPDRVVRTPSVYVALAQKISAQLQGTSLGDLKENKDTHELTFLAKSVGSPFVDVAYLFIAQVLGAQQRLSDQTLFGIFYQGIPAALDPSLGSLPDAGIDAAFIAQILTVILANGRGALANALSASVSGNVLPTSYSGLQESELGRIDELRVASVAGSPYLRGKTPVSQLLDAGSVSAPVAQAFTRNYAASGGRLGPTWKALRADPTLPKADLDTLKTTLSAGELLSGNLPLVKDTLGRLGDKSLASLQMLALLDEQDWQTLLQKVDPQAGSIPPVLPNDTPAQRIARFAKALAERFARRYSTTAFAGRLQKTDTSTFTRKQEIVSLLLAQPALSFKRTNIDQYLGQNKVAPDAAVTTELKAAQRLFRVSPHYESVEALRAAGYQSAQAIYAQGREQFLAQMTKAIGSPARASMAYARAQSVYATSLMAFGRYNLALNGTNVKAMGGGTPSAGTLNNLPSLQALFGSLDYFACEDCQSVYSPAAYLVDLLQYLVQFGAAGGGVTNARDALLARRPEIQYVALDCSNTNVTLPYIDLVNEILEAAISPPAPAPTLIDTTGTSAERRALPQNISSAAYALTAAAIFPLGLPFDLAMARTTASLSAIGTSWPIILRLFAAAPAGPSATAIACADLGISPAMQAVINQTSPSPWLRWGLAQNGNRVVDPKTRVEFPTAPGTTDWVTILNKVPILLNRSGLSLPQLYQLLEVNWVAQGGVTLQPGTTTLAGLTVLDADTDNMQFTGLTGDVLDRANRFLRLWNACQLKMWELDWALGTGDLDDAFLTFLDGALTVQKKLSLPFQEALSFWKPLETRDVVDHTGNEDAVVSSTYGEVFRNPTLLASPAFAAIFLSPPPPPALAPAAYADAVTAALGLSATDQATILGATGVGPNLSLAVLNVLLRYARLSAALSLSVPDLILWTQLTQGKPFDGTPADTLEFLRRLSVLQDTGIAVRDLDYLLRGQSADQSALAFTVDQLTAVLQSVRDAVAKLPAAILADPTTPAAKSAVRDVVVQALAAATNVTANVVISLLDATGVLPLPAATIALLLQTASPTPALFPALAAAFTRVAAGAALFTALGPTESELRFLVQNAGTLAWLDPSALPPGGNHYLLFEGLLRALKLDRRQAARSPKLFDVLAAWLPPQALPPDLATAIAGTANVPSLALALNATVDDVTAIATYLGATAPALGPPTHSLCDIAVLTAIAAALDVTARYKISGAALVRLATVPATAATASTAMSVFQAQYPQSAWFRAVQPVEDHLREQRRDALVAYLLGPGPAAPTGTTFLTTDDIFEYYLIDPEMAACAVTTRLMQASLAVQLFVQQCFLNLFFQTKVDTSNSHWSEWSWRGQFRYWQANRQVFLYPENYVLPELRKDASSIFTDLESDLRQSNLDTDAAETAFESYLRKLVELSRLVISAHYNQVNADGSKVLHVFAHTRGTPPKWYYRARTELLPGAGRWSAWEPLNLDIAPDNVVPVVWDQRLHLLWAIYKQESEKPKNSSIPGGGGGGTAETAQSFWAVEIAMSELSAGQWLPKRTVAEKLFVQKTGALSFQELSLSDGFDQRFDFTVPFDRSQLAFTLRANQDASFNLKVDVYYNLTFGDVAAQQIASTYSDDLNIPSHIASLTLPLPTSPAVVTEDGGFLPPGDLVDLAHEPSYALVNTATFSGMLASPQSYNFAGQDLVYGHFWTKNPGTVPLYVLAQTSAGGPANSVELLASIPNPRIVVPPQEPVFDSLDPFFVTDPSRTYLVQPEFFTISSRPVELDDLRYVKQWSTSFEFQTFYHPYAQTFLRELEIGGMPRLMARSLQTNPQAVRAWPLAFNFSNIYGPRPAVMQPYPGVSTAGDPGETWLDFAIGSYGAYSLYNWEIFYHAPMFVASLLLQNQRFQDAVTWLEYIFNPSDSSGGPSPQRFWQLAPLNAMNASDWADQQIQALLSTLAADTQQGISDPPTTTAIAQWIADPFDPHAVASLRISAYGKATVMKFLDTLIAWGDSLFAQYNAETVTRAEQLYILADMILGQKPVQIRLPDSGATPETYATLKTLDAFSNALVDVENVIVAPTPPSAIVNGDDSGDTLPQFPSKGKPSTLLFCIPPNQKLLSYWDTVADRLYKIRHCLNLQGVFAPLPLYAPPINPLLLAGGAGAGGAAGGAGGTAPLYRFQTYLQRAVELTNDVRAYGGLILSALEKKDAETLSVLRATQELDIQTRMLDVKTKQVTEAQDQITVLQNQRAVTQIRSDFYSNIAFMNEWEIAALALQGAALISNGAAIILDMTAGVAHVVPSFQAGASGFGGSPLATVNYGGENVASAASSWGTVARGLAGILSEAGGMAGTVGGYRRRADEWKLQADLAKAELTQIDSQITAANDRVATANSELDLQSRQVDNAQAVSDFLTNKYTNAALYDWMITQLTTVYTQAYQLAFSLAQQAQTAYQYELGRSQDTFIQFGYWDSQHKGLTSGESLLFDLRRMETEYLAQNTRELELTKHVSLAFTQPLALVQLRETGSCQINIDEALLDRDNPGQYFRRLRSVAVTIPCVAGPYTSVNATLTLTGALVRVTKPAAGYAPVAAGSAGDGVNVIASATPATATIATSSGQNDAGLFEVNLRDERWLPFEGQGAISQWTLVFDARDNAFDLSTVTDVILNVRYSARGGGDQTAANIVRGALKAIKQRSILVSARNTFGDDWFTFFNPTDPTATAQTFTLPLTDALFPFANLGPLKLAAITLVLALTKAQPPGTSIAATFGPTGGVANALSLDANTNNDGAGNPAAAMTSAPFATAVAPTSFTLTVPSASVPAGLKVVVNGQTRLDPQQIEDLVLLVDYTVG